MESETTQTQIQYDEHVTALLKGDIDNTSRKKIINILYADSRCNSIYNCRLDEINTNNDSTKPRVSFP